MFKKMAVILMLLMFSVGAWATVNDDYAPISYVGNGSTVNFAFDWAIDETSDIEVILRTVATGAEESLVETTDYTVSAVNNDYKSGPGGTVTMVSTYTSTSQITIRREIPKTQNASFVESDTTVLRVAALESAYDKLTMLIQQLQEELNRSIKIPRSDTSISVELDDSVSRASKVIASDSAGNITSITSIPEGSIAVSAYMETVNASANATAAKTALEIPTISAFAETFLDDGTAAAVRTTIGAVGLTGNESIAGIKTFTGANIHSGINTLGDSSQMASSAAPTTDADIANKKYVDDAGKPYARMFITAAQDNLTDATWTTITLDTDEFDSGTITDTANYKITPAVVGQYLVVGQITYTGVIAEKSYQAQIYFNGTSAKAIALAHTGAATTDVTVTVCDVIVFDADDYVQLRGQVNVGAATVDINVGTTDTFLVVYRL